MDNFNKISPTQLSRFPECNPARQDRTASGTVGWLDFSPDLSPPERPVLRLLIVTSLTQTLIIKIFRSRQKWIMKRNQRRGGLTIINLLRQQLTRYLIVDSVTLPTAQLSRSWFTSEPPPTMRVCVFSVTADTRASTS